MDQKIIRRGGARAGAGRPKGSLSANSGSVRKLAASFAKDAITSLVVIAVDVEAPVSDRVLAASKLLDIAIASD